MVPVNLPILAPITLTLPWGTTRHQIHYARERVTFRQHQETDLAFLAALDAPVPCACVEIYRDVLAGYRLFPGPRMPLQHARRLLDAHAAPILDHLTAAGFRVTRRYDHQAGSLPRLLLCAPNNHPPVLALSSVRALAELSGDGILLYQERIARAARTTIRKSTKRFHVSRLVGTGATCRPCGFEGGFRMVPLHVESEAHRQQVWTAFSEAFPATRTIV